MGNWACNGSRAMARVAMIDGPASPAGPQMDCGTALGWQQEPPTLPSGIASPRPVTFGGRLQGSRAPCRRRWLLRRCVPSQRLHTTV